MFEKIKRKKLLCVFCFLAFLIVAENIWSLQNGAYIRVFGDESFSPYELSLGSKRNCYVLYKLKEATPCSNIDLENMDEDEKGKYIRIFNWVIIDGGYYFGYKFGPLMCLFCTDNGITEGAEHVSILWRVSVFYD